ncbi:MAG: hypothetical protein ACE37B_12650 [Ilumatobacter sp.]|uniref:hypothetical protein n=1 Tax=Ilumatobacter sp. TaxID=1967498 RepID=UPI00391DAF4F
MTTRVSASIVPSRPTARPTARPIVVDLAADGSADVEVLVIGAGPQALAVMTHLLTAAPSLRDRIVAVDPTGTWMDTWNEQFARFEIDTLRSPGVHSPDPDPSALLDHISRHRLGSPGLPYGIPFTSAFRSFCDELVERYGLDELLRRGTVSSIRLPATDDTSETRTGIPNTGIPSTGIPSTGIPSTGIPSMTIAARHVIVCANPATPRLPDWAERVISPGDPAVVHASDIDLSAVELGGEHVVIVGGGLTAAHLTTAALRRGARVTMIVRRALRGSDFDIDAGWLGPRFLADFESEPDPSVRAAAVAAARDGGSITPTMLRRLRSAIDDSTLTLLERSQVIDLQVERRLRLDVDVDGERRVVCADRCWLATGSTPSLDAGPAFADLATHCQTVDGLPVLSADLRVATLPIHVTGRLAALQLGPAAGNLWGARRAAQTITRAITGIDLATDRSPTTRHETEVDATARHTTTIHTTTIHTATSHTATSHTATSHTATSHTVAGRSATAVAITFPRVGP